MSDAMQQDAMQERVFAFLGDPRTHGGASVKRIDTHAASVFLAGERAFKVKRAVRFPFLDYSTLEKRNAACEAELRVNRAFAPDLYRRVVAITVEAGDALAIGGEGDPVEWAVEMNRFDETRTLDHLVERGELDRALAGRLAVMVAKAHASADEKPDAPWLASFDSILAQNEEEFAQHSAVFDPAVAKDLMARSRAVFARVRPLLAERQRHGLVRRCHGDLHLRNIVMMGETPTLFDAIEFSEAIANIDVLYDLAFLLMDLIERGLAAPANAVLNSYLHESGRAEDIDGLAALPLFMSVRAQIRAKVTAARLAHAAEDERFGITRSAQNYFRLAQRLIDPPPATLLAVGGLSGTGKSVLAQGLAPLVPPIPGAVVVRSDVERKILFGVAATERLPKDAYAAEVSGKVYALMDAKAARVLAAGHSVIVDAVFARAHEREAIRDVAAKAGADFAGLFLTLDLTARKTRLGARRGDASDATVETADIQERYDLGTVDWKPVDASGTPDDTLARACKVLEK